jgi:uncharacterized membrane protein
MAMARVRSVDVVRGAVMVLMALDHVRDFVTNVRFQPENLARGTAGLFATRWVTHFCAPTFFLLAGVGIGLAMHRGKTVADMTRYLVTRGLWLLVLELIITPIGWRFSLNLLPAFALVLWALGWSMIAMALVIRLPKKLVLAVSLLLVFGHNVLDDVRPATFGSLGWLWNFVHAPGFVLGGKLFLIYTFIPWVAVMALGYVLADVYAWETKRRRSFLIYAGAAAIVIFVTLRAFNVYGDPGPWTVQRTEALTVASFLNVNKYPPSLLFLLMTLGPAMVALALTENVKGRVAGWIEVYGRVPMFYYVFHIVAAHLVGMALAGIQGGVLIPRGMEWGCQGCISRGRSW